MQTRGRPARIARAVVWLMYLGFVWLALVAAGVSIDWAAGRHLGAALASVTVTVICGVTAREFWRGLGRPSPLRR